MVTTNSCPGSTAWPAGPAGCRPPPATKPGSRYWPKPPDLKWGHGRQASWLAYGLDQLKTECAALVTAASQIRASAVDAALRQLARRIAEATAEAAQVRRAEGKLEFHDLLVLARDLLTGAGHGAAVRDALHQQYRRLLLDEFQDTDPIQIELAVRIAAGRAGGAADWADVPVPPGRLFLVGDPKQSIYRFRRADIATYLRAQQRIGEPGHPGGQLPRHRTGARVDQPCLRPADQRRRRNSARLPTAAGMPARPARQPGRGGTRGPHPPRQAVRRRTARRRSSRRGQRCAQLPSPDGGRSPISATRPAGRPGRAGGMSG